tara:strand:- start:1451 stop:1999 length:549 start_codon:yes stop_codon:yes gene_type:complete
MAGRPKNSLSGIGGTLAEFYGAKKLANIDSKFVNLSSEIRQQNNEIARQTAVNKAGFTGIMELQVANLLAIRQVETQIIDMHSTLSSITDIFLRNEMREEKVGELRIQIMYIEEALDHIDSIKNDYAPWAAFELQILKDIVEDYDIDIKYFKRFGKDELKWVRSVLKRIESTYQECFRIMEG